jgi:Phage tail assembly chaperone protein
MTQEQIQALFKLYPQVLTLSGDIARDADGNEISYDLAAVTTQAQKDACKAQAKALLAASDWSSLPDVQITNKSAFDNYRAILRGYVISPVTDPTWPTEPQPVWG